MWDRFELLWTAFEKFALFFSFIASLVILTIVVLAYNAVLALEPAPPQIEVEPVIQTMSEGFEKIQGTTLHVEVPISHTVPMSFDVRISPRTKLNLVDGSSLGTGTITVNLMDGAGKIVGKDATLKFDKDSALDVNMDFVQRIEFKVPIWLTVPVDIPLSALNLSSEINALNTMTVTHAPEDQPEAVKKGGAQQ